MAGVEPVEQRGARAADVQEAGRRGREARDDASIDRLRSSALSSSLNAAMQRTSAPNIGEAPLPQRARSYWKTRISALHEKLEKLLEAERAQLPPWFVVGFGAGSRPGSRSARREQWLGFLCIAAALALLGVRPAVRAGRRERWAGSPWRPCSAARSSGAAPNGWPSTRLEPTVVTEVAGEVRTVDHLAAREIDPTCSS